MDLGWVPHCSPADVHCFSSDFKELLDSGHAKSFLQSERSGRKWNGMVSFFLVTQSLYVYIVHNITFDFASVRVRVHVCVHIA